MAKKTTKKASGTKKNIDPKKLDPEAIKKLQSLMQNQLPKPVEGVPGMGTLSGVELMQKLALIQKELGVKPGIKNIAGVSLNKKELEMLNLYASSVIKKFGKYIRAVVFWGSSKRKATSDFDVAILVDDTDVTRMSQSELKTKLFYKLVQMGHEINKKIHPQPYTLTEWWEYVRYGNPVIFNILRNGIPLYDLGFFLPIQIIFKKGLIKPSSESIDQHMHISAQLMLLTDELIHKKLIQNFEQAVVSSAQSLLMENGYRPPAPREVSGFLDKLRQQGLVEKEYVRIAKDAVDAFKAVEHGTKKEFTFEEIGKYYADTKKFVLEMERLLKIERKNKGEPYTFEVKKYWAEAKKAKKQKNTKRPGLIDVNTQKQSDADQQSNEIIKKQVGKR